MKETQTFRTAFLVQMNGVRQMIKMQILQSSTKFFRLLRKENFVRKIP